MGKLRNGFVSGVLGIVLFGITYGFDFYGFREYYLNILVPLPFFVLPPIGLFLLLSRGKKATPSVVSVTEPPRVMGTETAMQELERLRKEDSLRQNLEKEERLDKSKLEAFALVASPARPNTEAQPTTKLSNGALENGHVDKVPINGNGQTDNDEILFPLTIEVVGKRDDFEIVMSPTEVISKMRKKKVS